MHITCQQTNPPVGRTSLGRTSSRLPSRACVGGSLCSPAYSGGACWVNKDLPLGHTRPPKCSDGARITSHEKGAPYDLKLARSLLHDVVRQCGNPILCILSKGPRQQSMGPPFANAAQFGPLEVFDSAHIKGKRAQRSSNAKEVLTGVM